MVAHKNLLTKKHKEQLLSALQPDGKLVNKPTPKQRGGFVGMLLASIGVPLLVKALTGDNIRTRSSLVSCRTPPIIVPKKHGGVTKGSGTGMQNRPARMLPYYPPPIWTNPEDFLGKGVSFLGKKKITKRKRVVTRKEQSIQQHPSTWGNIIKPKFVNKPISTIEIKQ